MVRPNAPFAKALPRNAYPGARWVQPVVYVDIAYGGRTGDGMLRHPSFKSAAGIQ
ncbi:hypothetical protein [Mesorhizobium sp. M0859]|uniref:ATP dependent DNA ligase n=1 Tax=Mesorhizobium sp. M0859 TaxID=2957014 RepID=UPI0033359080